VLGGTLFSARTGGGGGICLVKKEEIMILLRKFWEHFTREEKKFQNFSSKLIKKSYGDKSIRLDRDHFLIGCARCDHFGMRLALSCLL
jgi:hypothetical protein